MQKIAERLTKRLCENNIVSAEDADIYEYGIYQIFTILINTATAALIGIAFGAFWQCVIFMAVFIPMRSYAGGYHAPNRIECYIISTLLVAASMAVIKYVNFTYMMYACGICGTGLLQLWLAPCESENKPLSPNEKNAYRRKALIFAFSFMICAAVLYYFGITWASDSILTALVVQSLMLALGSALNYNRGEKEKP